LLGVAKFRKWCFNTGKWIDREEATGLLLHPGPRHFLMVPLLLRRVQTLALAGVDHVDTLVEECLEEGAPRRGTSDRVQARNAIDGGVRY